jgi:hypothetical protein
VVVSAATTSLVLVVVDEVLTALVSVEEVVVTPSTTDSLLLVDDVQSDQVSTLPFVAEDDVVTASTKGLVVVVVVELLVSTGAVDELVEAPLTGVSLLPVSVVVLDELVAAPSTEVSLLVPDDVQSAQVIESYVVGVAWELLAATAIGSLEVGASELLAVVTSLATGSDVAVIELADAPSTIRLVEAVSGQPVEAVSLPY